jgi:glycine oxidase
MKVLIIGGGVMGCSVALELQRPGVEVTVLERSIPGAEASSAAAGILAPQAEATGPGPFLELCLDSRARYPAFVKRVEELSGLEVGYRESGVLRMAAENRELGELEHTVKWQRERGLRAELLTLNQARALEPQLSEGLTGAARFPDDHQVDNRLLVRALSMAAARLGVRFATGFVRGVASAGGRATGVDLDGTTLEANAVVVAAGSWSGLVQGSAVDPRVLRPMRGQMVQLLTRLPLLSHVVFSHHGYLVPRADGRLIAGSTMERAGYEKHVTAAGLQKILTMAIGLCPALAEAPVTESWAGLRPFTEDQLPILGPGPLAGLFLATGHFRNGILLAPVTAHLIAEQVLGRTPSVDLRPFRFDRFAP